MTSQMSSSADLLEDIWVHRIIYVSQDQGFFKYLITLTRHWRHTTRKGWNIPSWGGPWPGSLWARLVLFCVYSFCCGVFPKLFPKTSFSPYGYVWVFLCTHHLNLMLSGCFVPHDHHCIWRLQGIFLAHLWKQSLSMASGVWECNSGYYFPCLSHVIDGFVIILLFFGSENSPIRSKSNFYTAFVLCVLLSADMDPMQMASNVWWRVSFVFETSAK